MDKTTELKETYIFVELLTKYKFICKRKRSIRNLNCINHKARIAMTKEFNEKCNTKLSVEQIIKKLYNFKFRLRRKNLQSLAKNKRPRFSALEERFLNLWDDSGIEFSKKTKSKPSELSPEDTTCETKSEDSNNPSVRTNITNAVDQPECCNEYSDAKIELKVDYGTIKEEPSPQTTIEPSKLNNWDLESDSESNSSYNDFDDNNDPYASMTLDELKRAALISKMKMLKAAEASARAKEKLKLFELSILHRNNRNNIPNFF